MQQEKGMKMRVATTLKWNVVDKLATQVLYAVTGVILARVLGQADFGLIGAILVFQAFASLFVDSGFSYALIQRKAPTNADYSTVFWFNLSMAVFIYAILFVGAPFIADCFKGDERLIPLSRVMFLTFIVNATAIVQTNRLMKQMDVKMIAVSNSLGLIAGAVVGILLALTGFGPWALVWQAVSVAAVKSLVLWIYTGWKPAMVFSWVSLKSFFGIGGSMMFTSFLNTAFQNIYSFFIGNRLGMVPLGYYTQADKWSKMGVSSLSAIFTSSFLPVLSKYQDDPTRFAAATAKMNRFTSYITFPLVIFLMALATPVFHALLGEKWDASILLFQLLLIRGVFVILTSLYQNYVMSLGRARMVAITEMVRDGVAFAAIIFTLPFLALSLPGNLTYGIAIFLTGQVVASIVSWVILLVIAARLSWRNPWQFIADSLPYLLLSLAIGAIVYLFITFVSGAWMQLFSGLIVGGGLYLGINALLGSVVQKDVLSYFFAHFKH